jgi:beta-lactamase regulating signal transducer with metallopeptidase domain
VWLTVIAGCLLLPLISTVVPKLSLPILPAETTIQGGDSDGVAGAVPATATAIEAVGAMTAGLEAAAGFRLLVGIYVIGVIAWLGSFAVSIARLARFERSMSACRNRELVALKDALCKELDVGRPVQILVSDSTGSPFTWGVWRPRVVLPVAADGWSAERMANVMRHELCHVKRFDWLRLCLQHTVTAIYWFNPFVWLAARRCRYEAERACDDYVLESGGRSADYAEQLVDLMAASRRPQISAIALGDGDFVRRIRAILNPANEVTMMSRVKTQVSTIGIAASVVVLAACQVTNGQPATEVPAQQSVTAQAAQNRRVVAAEAANARRVERADADAVAGASRTRALTEQIEVMARALEEQQLALRQSQEQLLRQERVLQELSVSLNRQADILVQRERELAERQRALAELEAVPFQDDSGE